MISTNDALSITHKEYSNKQWELAFALETTGLIGQLTLLGNFLTEEKLSFLSPILHEERFNYVTNLNLSYNKIESSPALALFLKNKPIENLDLSYNPLKDEGVSLICSSLIGKNLMTLDLTQCKIQNEGCAKIAHLLASCPSLQDLRLSDNPINDASPLITALKVNRALHTLSLSWTNIGDKTFLQFCNTVLNSRSIKKLLLSGNSFTPACLEPINKLFHEGLYFQFDFNSCYFINGVYLAGCNSLFTTVAEKNRFKELFKPELFSKYQLEIDNSAPKKALLKKNIEQGAYLEEISITGVMLEDQEILEYLPYSLKSLSLIKCGLKS